MRVITLEYHDVIEGADFDGSGFPGAAANSYKLARADFEAHLDRLAGRPAVGVDVRAMPPGQVPVLITFDDGGRSALEVAAPALERRGYVGHFFMTTGQLDSTTFCSRDALRELASRGHVIGSHSHSHPVRMARLSDAELDREWRESCAILAEVLQAPVTVASVPGGYFSAAVARAAAGAGIRYLFTSEPVSRVEVMAGCRVLGRYTLRRRSPAGEVASLAGGLGMARLRQYASWNAKKAVKAAAGDTYLRLRASMFGDQPSPPPPASR